MHKKLNETNAKSVEETTKTSDCHPYSRTFHTSSPKLTTKFMDSKYNIAQAAQIITIHCCHHYHQMNHFELVQHCVVYEL